MSSDIPIITHLSNSKSLFWYHTTIMRSPHRPCGELDICMQQVVKEITNRGLCVLQNDLMIDLESKKSCQDRVIQL